MVSETMTRPIQQLLMASLGFQHLLRILQKHQKHQYTTLSQQTSRTHSCPTIHFLFPLPQPSSRGPMLCRNT